MYNWKDAERFAVSHMRAIGFLDARLTIAGADGGIDVLSERGVAQVKYYATSPVGIADVQRIQGAALGRAAIFYSNSGYSRSAREFANAAEVALFEYALPDTVRPANETARTSVQSHSDLIDAVHAKGLLLGHMAHECREAIDDVASLVGALIERVRSSGASPEIIRRTKELEGIWDQFEPRLDSLNALTSSRFPELERLMGTGDLSTLDDAFDELIILWQELVIDMKEAMAPTESKLARAFAL